MNGDSLKLMLKDKGGGQSSGQLKSTTTCSLGDHPSPGYARYSVSKIRVL
ncbi:hypothetical protein O9992_30865 [Vibrio lentus]|nr:hypothetical protein [Vibrio lentus]